MAVLTPYATKGRASRIVVAAVDLPLANKLNKAEDVSRRYVFAVKRDNPQRVHNTRFPALRVLPKQNNCTQSSSSTAQSPHEQSAHDIPSKQDSTQETTRETLDVPILESTERVHSSCRDSQVGPSYCMESTGRSPSSCVESTEGCPSSYKDSASGHARYYSQGLTCGAPTDCRPSLLGRIPYGGPSGSKPALVGRIVHGKEGSTNGSSDCKPSYGRQVSTPGGHSDFNTVRRQRSILGNLPGDEETSRSLPPLKMRPWVNRPPSSAGQNPLHTKPFRHQWSTRQSTCDGIGVESSTCSATFSSSLRHTRAPRRTVVTILTKVPAKTQVNHLRKRITGSMAQCFAPPTWDAVGLQYPEKSEPKPIGMWQRFFELENLRPGREALAAMKDGEIDLLSDSEEFHERLAISSGFSILDVSIVTETLARVLKDDGGQFTQEGIGSALRSICQYFGIPVPSPSEYEGLVGQDRELTAEWVCELIRQHEMRQTVTFNTVIPG